MTLPQNRCKQKPARTKAWFDSVKVHQNDGQSPNDPLHRWPMAVASLSPLLQKWSLCSLETAYSQDKPGLVLCLLVGLASKWAPDAPCCLPKTAIFGVRINIHFEVIWTSSSRILLCIHQNNDRREHKRDERTSTSQLSIAKNSPDKLHISARLSYS